MEKKKINKKVKFSRFLVLILILSVLSSVFVISSFAAEVPTDLIEYDVYVPAGWTCSRASYMLDLLGDCSIDGVDYHLRQNGTFSMAFGTKYDNDTLIGSYRENFISLFLTDSTGSPILLYVTPENSLTFKFTGGADTDNSLFIQWLVDNNAEISKPTAADSLVSVWTDIMTWIVSALSSVNAVFYGVDGLTFIGTLAVISVAIGLSFLLIAVISRFLSLRS